MVDSGRVRVCYPDDAHQTRETDVPIRWGVRSAVSRARAAALLRRPHHCFASTYRGRHDDDVHHPRRANQKPKRNIANAYMHISRVRLARSQGGLAFCHNLERFIFLWDSPRPVARRLIAQSDAVCGSTSGVIFFMHDGV